MPRGTHYLNYTSYEECSCGATYKHDACTVCKCNIYTIDKLKI